MSKRHKFPKLNQVIRVFPRRTRATPDDRLAFVGNPPMFLQLPASMEIHISVVFTWDIPKAQELERQWRFAFPANNIKIGGPAFDDPGSEFAPGLYLKSGYIITSRGCPNHCDKCMVPEREGKIRLLPIRDGFDLLDNNFLACPTDHRYAVLEMFKRQGQRPIFSGGLEAARLTPDICEDILAVRPSAMFLAYDRPEEWRHVERAAKLIQRLSGWSDGTLRHYVGCYVLIGYEGDTVAEAEKRIAQVIGLNVRAYPMYFRDKNFSHRPAEWHDVVGGVMAFGSRA